MESNNEMNDDKSPDGPLSPSEKVVVYAEDSSGSSAYLTGMVWDLALVVFLIVPIGLCRSAEVAILFALLVVLMIPFLFIASFLLKWRERPHELRFDEIGIEEVCRGKTVGVVKWSDNPQVVSAIEHYESSAIPVLGIGGEDGGLEFKPRQFELQGFPILRELETRMAADYDRQVESYLTGDEYWTVKKTTLRMEEGVITVTRKSKTVASFAASEVLRVDCYPGMGRQLLISYEGGQVELEELPANWHLLLYVLRSKLGLEKKMHPRLDVIDAIGGPLTGNGSLDFVALIMKSMLFMICLLTLPLVVGKMVTHGVTIMSGVALVLGFALTAVICKRYLDFWKSFLRASKEREAFEAAYEAEVAREMVGDEGTDGVQDSAVVECHELHGRTAYDHRSSSWLGIVIIVASLLILAGVGLFFYVSRNMSEVYGVPMAIAVMLVWMVPGLLGARLAEVWMTKRALATIALRSPCWIRRPADCLFMDRIPRERWGKVKMETAIDAGPINVDAEKRTVYWEGGRERLAIPAAAIASCSVEEGGTSGGPLHIVALILMVRMPEGPAELSFCIRKQNKPAKHRKALQPLVDEIQSWDV